MVPLSRGRTPGGRKHPTHAVDHILKECQALALDILSPRPDTSYEAQNARQTATHSLGGRRTARVVN